MMLWMPGSHLRIDPDTITAIWKSDTLENAFIYYTVGESERKHVYWTNKLKDSRDSAFAWLEAITGKKGNRGMALTKVEGCKDIEWIDPKYVVNCYNMEAPAGEYHLQCQLVGGSKTLLKFTDNAARAAFVALTIESQQPTIVGGGKRMLNQVSEDLKRFLSENREVIYIVILVLIIDQYIFEGAFRDRIKGIVDNFLKKAEHKAGVGAAPADVPATATRVE